MLYQLVASQAAPQQFPAVKSEMSISSEAVLLLAISGVIAVASFLAKRTLGEIDEKIKSLAEKIQSLEAADTLISSRISEVQTEMALNYVTKEAFLHAITVYDAKVDSVLENLKTISISLQVEKEIRERERTHAKQ